jgi:ASC-1-like (ASCH) protein
MQTHYLKTWVEYFQAVKLGRKSFEVRLNDRNYQVGDTLILQEWDQAIQEYTGEEFSVVVTYILKGGQFGIDPRYVVIGIKF